MPDILNDIRLGATVATAGLAGMLSKDDINRMSDGRVSYFDLFVAQDLVAEHGSGFRGGVASTLYDAIDKKLGQQDTPATIGESIGDYASWIAAGIKAAFD